MEISAFSCPWIRLRPHNFNAGRCHKFSKKKYRVTNWTAYNESLCNRGDLTIWIVADARQHWIAPRRGMRGGQPRYSDLAITLCLTLGMVYKLPLRQTQGLVRSISQLMHPGMPVPDFSALPRRGHNLSLPIKSAAKRTEPVHLAVDSTGLKIFGEGAYDGIPIYDLLKTRSGENVEIIIPPPKNATRSSLSSHDPTLRDRRITEIPARGRMAWQTSGAGNQRSRIETQMGRWKAVIGPKLKARHFENQQTEAKIGVAILSKITDLGRPVFEQIARPNLSVRVNSD